MNPFPQLNTLILCTTLVACGGGTDTATTAVAATDSLATSTASTTTGTSTSATSSNATATTTPAAAVACALSYSALNTSLNLTSTSRWTCGTTRLLTANGIPDHASTGGSFATPVSVQNISVSMPLAPAVATTVTQLNKTAIGYVLNGVKLDPQTDGSCASSATSTANGAGCVAAGGRDPWVLEAIGGAFLFGTDTSNAHVQPNGQYHYHGMPEGYLTQVNKGAAMTLVGFAVDGFPIYGRYGYSTAGNAGSAIKTITSSYQKKTTADAGRPSTAIFPMGTFTSDYQYVASSGDLDECNGRTGVTPEYPAGTYHYYITDTFPYAQRCIKGSR